MQCAGAVGKVNTEQLQLTGQYFVSTFWIVTMSRLLDRPCRYYKNVLPGCRGDDIMRTYGVMMTEEEKHV